MKKKWLVIDYMPMSQVVTQIQVVEANTELEARGFEEHMGSIVICLDDQKLPYKVFRKSR